MGSIFVMPFWCDVCGHTLAYPQFFFAAAADELLERQHGNHTETGHWERHRPPTMYGEWRMAKNIVLICFIFIDWPGCSDAPDFRNVSITVSANGSFPFQDIPRQPDTRLSRFGRRLNAVRYMVFRRKFAHIYLSPLFRLRRPSGGDIPRHTDTRLFEVREAFKFVAWFSGIYLRICRIFFASGSPPGATFQGILLHAFSRFGRRLNAVRCMVFRRTFAHISQQFRLRRPSGPSGGPWGGACAARNRRRNTN